MASKNTSGLLQNKQNTSKARSGRKPPLKSAWASEDDPIYSGGFVIGARGRGKRKKDSKKG